MTILGCLGISEFWTISDWTELGLVELSLSSFVSCHELCMSFHFFLHDMSMGFMRRNHCDLFCSFVKSCACIGSWIWIEFAVCHKFALFLSETLEFGRSHITYQDVRHASWGSIECDLCRKCNSSVKV